MSQKNLVKPSTPQATGSKIVNKNDLNWKVMSSLKSNIVLGYANVRERAPVQNPNKLNKNNVYAKWIDTGIISPGDHVYQTSFDYPFHAKVQGSVCKGTLSFGYAADDYVREIHLNGDRVYSCGGACATEDFFQMKSVHGLIKGENNTLQFVVHKSKNFMQFRDGRLKISTEGFLFQHDQIFVQLETCKKSMSNIEFPALNMYSVLGTIAICVVSVAMYAYFLKFRKTTTKFVKLYNLSSKRGSLKDSVPTNNPVGTNQFLKSFPDAFLNRLRKTGFKVENIKKEGANKDQILFLNNKGDLMWSDRLFSSIQSLLNLKKVYSDNLTGGFTMEFNTGKTVHFKLKPSEYPFTNESMILHFNAIMKQHQDEHSFVQEMGENNVTNSSRDSIASNITLEKSESLKPSSLSELVRTSSFSTIKRLSLSTTISESPQAEDKQEEKPKATSTVMSSLRRLSFRASSNADAQNSNSDAPPISPTVSAKKPGFPGALSPPSSSSSPRSTTAAAATTSESVEGSETAPTFMNMLKLSATKSSKSLGKSTDDEAAEKTSSLFTKLRSASPFARKSVAVSPEVSASPVKVDSQVTSIIKRMSFNAGSRLPAADEASNVMNITTSSASIMTKLRSASPFTMKSDMKANNVEEFSLTPGKRDNQTTSLMRRLSFNAGSKEASNTVTKSSS